MVYRGLSRGNNNSKLIAAAALSLLILLFAVVYVIRALFLNNGYGREYNTLLYAQVLNDSMPIIQVTSFEDETMAERHITVGGELLKMIGINVYNPMAIMGREISFLNSFGTEAQTREDSTGEYALNIDPFSLPEGSVNVDSSGKQGNSGDSGSSGSSGNSGETLPNKTVTVQDPSLKKQINNSKPEVLIYHTHTTESYAPNGNYTEDAAKNVCAVGDALANELESNYGISVIHDTTIHNSSFNESYYRSRETVDKYMQKYGDFKLIIDLHRDSVYSKNSVTTKMNGENVSKVMFVLTKKNPHFDKNYDMALKLKAISDGLFPGFCKEVYFFNYGSKYFNQDKSNNAILIEVGAQVNTLDESKASAKYIGRVIAEYLNKK